MQIARANGFAKLVKMLDSWPGSIGTNDATIAVQQQPSSVQLVASTTTTPVADRGVGHPVMSHSPQDMNNATHTVDHSIHAANQVTGQTSEATRPAVSIPALFQQHTNEPGDVAASVDVILSQVDMERDALRQLQSVREAAEKRIELWTRFKTVFDQLQQ